MFQKILINWHHALSIVIPLFIITSISLIGCVYTFSTPKQYESQAKVWIRPKSSGDQSQYVFSPLGSFFASPMVTVCEILKSQAVLADAKSALDNKQNKTQINSISLSFDYGQNYFVNSVKDSDIVLLAYRSPDPQLSRAALQSVISAFLKLNSAQMSGPAGKTREFLENQYKVSADKVAELRAKLRELQDAKGTVNVDQQASSLLSQETRSNTNLEDNKLDISAQQAKLDELRAQLHISEEQLAAANMLEHDDVMKGLRSELSAHLVLLADLTTRLRDAHPRVRRAKRGVDSIQNALRARAREIAGEEGVEVLTTQISFSAAQQKISDEILEGESHLAGLRAKLAKNTSAVDVIRSKMKSLPEEQLRFAELSRRAEAAAIALRDVENQLRLSKMAEFVTEHTSNIQIIDQPTLPLLPVTPNVPLYLSGSVIIGLALGLVSFYFLRSLSNPFLRSVPEIAAVIEYPVLGWSKIEPVSDPKSLSAIVASMDRLRLSWRTTLAEEKKIIVVTSSTRGDGEHVAAAAFALSLAKSASKVLLLDASCDEGISRLFNLPPGPGLYDYLASGNPDLLTKIIRDVPVQENLKVIPAGAKPANSGRLESSHYDSLISQLSTESNFVIIATDALNISLDALALLKPGVHLLLVAKLNHSLKESLRLAASELTHQKIASSCIYLFGANNGDVIDHLPRSVHENNTEGLQEPTAVW